MKTSIIKIGNSKGIRIPKAFLEQLNLRGDVQLSIKDGSLVITPYSEHTSGRELALMSEAALAKTWNDPREDEAWAHLQLEQS